MCVKYMPEVSSGGSTKGAGSMKGSDVVVAGGSLLFAIATKDAPLTGCLKNVATRSHEGFLRQTSSL